MTGLKFRNIGVNNNFETCYIHIAQYTLCFNTYIIDDDRYKMINANRIGMVNNYF